MKQESNDEMPWFFDAVQDGSIWVGPQQESVCFAVVPLAEARQLWFDKKRLEKAIEAAKIIIDLFDRDKIVLHEETGFTDREDFSRKAIRTLREVIEMD